MTLLFDDCEIKQEKRKAQPSRLWYEKYRWFFTSAGALVIGGKSAEQNEEVIKKHTKEYEIVMHTKQAGSPFSVIKTKEPSARDLQETAIFTACFSRAWREGKKKTEIHIFRGEQICKEKQDKPGTFHVLGEVQKVNAELKLGLLFQQGKLRAVPLGVGKPFLIIKPGKLEKERTIELIKEKLKEKGIDVSKEEIGRAIPSGGFSISQ